MTNEHFKFKPRPRPNTTSTESRTIFISFRKDEAELRARLEKFVKASGSHRTEVLKAMIKFCLDSVDD